MNETTANRASRLPLMTAGVLVAAVGLVMCAYQLRITEVAVVTTLGRPAVVSRPGLHWRLPWPIQKVTRIDNRKQVLTTRMRQTTTRDNINLVVRCFATWKVADPLLFFNSVGTLFEAENQLRTLLESKQETVIRGRLLADFLRVGDGGGGFAAAEQELLASVVDQAAANYGVAVDAAGISQLNLDESSTPSVLERMAQEQAKIAAGIRSAGITEATIRRDTADSEKAKKVAEAEAEARRIRGDAQAAAAAQYERFNEDPEFAIFLRNLDALLEITKTKTTLVLDPRTPPFHLLRGAGEPGGGRDGGAGKQAGGARQPE